MKLSLKSYLQSFSLAVFIIICLTPSAPAVDSNVMSIKLPKEKVEEAFRPRRLALIVGVNNFDDRDFQDLKYPNKDVEDVYRFLKENNFSKKDRYIKLTEGDATLAGVLKALDLLESLNSSEEDVILIYFSTHGTLDYDNPKKLERFAALKDTQFKKVSDTGLAIDYLINRISRMKSRKKALILALCHSGTGKSQLPPEIQKEALSLKSGFFPKPLYQASSAMMVLSASAWSEAAREDEVLKNDIYTHFLIKGLTSYDSNQDGAVSLFEAHEFARSKTYDYTRGRQTPTALINMRGIDPIILKGQINQKARPLIFADNSHFRDLEVYVDGNLKGSLWQPKLAKGGHIKLTLVDPKYREQPLLDHQFFLEANHSYSVSSLLERPPGYGFETGVYLLPAPTHLDSSQRQDFLAPGLALRAIDVLGSPFYLTFKYHFRSYDGQETIDEQKTIYRYQIEAYRGELGYSFYPRRHMQISLGVGFETMSLERQVSNSSFERPHQKLNMNYPTLTSGWVINKVFRDVYSGIELDIFPVNSVSIKIDDRQEKLSSISGRILMGLKI